MYNNYIFSFYNTLVDISTDEDKDRLWSDLAVFLAYQGAIYTPEELKGRFRKIQRKLEERSTSEHSDVDFQDIVYLLYREKDVSAKNKQVKFTAQVFRMLSLNYIKMKPGAKEFLEELKQAGKKLYILANAQRSFLIPELKMLGIRDYFEEIRISSDSGLAKPDPGVFTEFMEENKLKPKRTLVLGSRCDIDIKGAREAGLDTLLFDGGNEEGTDATYVVQGADFAKARELVLAP